LLQRNGTILACIDCTIDVAVTAKKGATTMKMTALKAAVLAGGMLVPGVAAAATAAIVTTDLNIRTGPGTGYYAFDVIPVGGRVTVYGCATGYNWCDVGWAGTRGWVSGNYLAYRSGGYNSSIASIGISIGVPIVGFDFYDYHDHWYRDRSWYRARDRAERREERREIRREVREERRDDRRDIRAERRDVRDARRDLREARRDGENLRDERRRLRQERRELREERRDRRN
jgi:uncharacterized protein YraI